ncbi:hypothetical protein [Rahnella aceris]
MLQDAAHKDIFDLLSQSLISDEGGYLVAQLSESDIYISDEHVKASLSIAGYLNYEQCISIQKEKKELYINKSVDAWRNQVCPIHSTHRDFWQQISLSENIPLSFFIEEDRTSSCTIPEPDIVIAYQAFFAWKKLLNVVSDHQQNNKTILFITTEKEIKKLDISFKVDPLTFKKLKNPQQCLKETIRLQQLLDLNDPHKKERLSVMRATIAEVIESIDSEECTIFNLINKSCLVSKKFDDLYDIYTRRFSVNKILNEIDEKNLDYTGKINEFISSSQTKAFAIPGALIAVGALAKTGSVLEGVIIIGGLWMIKSMTTKTNDIYRESFDTLKTRIVKAFEKYLKLDEDKEIKENAIEMEEDLKDKISNAKIRLNSIDTAAKVMFYGGLAYVLIRLLSYYLVNLDVADTHPQASEFIKYFLTLTSIHQ